MGEIQEKILEFIRNRSEINETTAARHIHRRFDMPEEEIEAILDEMWQKKKLVKSYDEHYREIRFGPNQSF